MAAECTQHRRNENNPYELPSNVFPRSSITRKRKKKTFVRNVADSSFRLSHGRFASFAGGRGIPPPIRVGLFEKYFFVEHVRRFRATV